MKYMQNIFYDKVLCIHNVLDFSAKAILSNLGVLIFSSRLICCYLGDKRTGNNSSAPAIGA